MNAFSTIEGRVFNIQRHSTEDGPGIRTTVFLKGCPMRCPWCHNPEGIKTGPELIWYDIRCIGARDCLKACPQNALNLIPEGMIIDRELCDGCALCVEACPAAALEVVGSLKTSKEVAETALRDKVFYEKSGGGVTISGGEPSLQFDFSLAVMDLLKREGVHLALDTCGSGSWDRLGPLVEMADLVLYDLKVMDEKKHRSYTGIPLELVLENARRIAGLNKPMWIRTPIIPCYTDHKQNIEQIAGFILENLPTVERYDLLSFNNTCSKKYQRLDMAYILEDKELKTEDEMKELGKIAEEQGLKNVRWAGFTRI